MQISRVIPLVAGTLAFATTGCQDAANSPTAPDTPQFNFSNGPASPGKSGVIRSQSGEVFVTTDGALSLVAVHLGPDAVAPFGCGGADLPVYESNEVNNPAGIARSLAQVKNAPIYIYDFWAFVAALSGNLCGFLADDWLYQGMHDLLLLGDFSGGGTTLGWTGNGDVFDPSGARFRYTEHQNAVVKKDGSVRWLNEDIGVQQTGQE